MKSLFTLAAIILTSFAINAQSLYIKTFGNPKDKPLLFLHGGPGYNSVNFEQTTANLLSQNGFYVIVYDRRGEGRSIDNNAKFTFEQTFEDINLILSEKNISKVSLLGHSFGGVIATLYTEKYPTKVNQIILIGAPIVMQETFKTIIKSSKELYESKGDNNNLNYIKMLENMDKSSLEYSSYCFGHAMQNGFYFPKQMSEEAKSIFSNFRKDTLAIKYASKMTFEAPKGFWENEKYTSIDLSNSVKNIMKLNLSIYGIYGKDDGLYSAEQIESLKNLIGAQHVKYIDNCSHNVFIDQQSAFIEALKIWVK
jgi:proline iminopeptidase